MTVYSVLAPNSSIPLTIDSAHIASNGCHLLLVQAATSQWQTATSTDDDSVSPHLVAPSPHGIVIFNLLLAFASAGTEHHTSLSSPPVVVNLQPTGAPTCHCQHLTATEDCALLACAQRSGVSVLALRHLKVRHLTHAAECTQQLCNQSTKSQMNILIITPLGRRQGYQQHSRHRVSIKSVWISIW